MVGENSAYLYAKCEFMNPSLSLKDRMANYILDIAEAQGQLKRGDVILTSPGVETPWILWLVHPHLGRGE
ncbi:MAG: hypothetical protein F6K24_06590 [Okeania sp. SIO2D1]|nr:hypothetical protein [Okeania sp. SIO2D1]